MAIGQRDELARRIVVRALRDGETVKAAAALAGISRPTIYNWARRGDEEMAALLPGNRRATPSSIDAMASALRALKSIADDETAPAAVRMKAALELAKLTAPPKPVAPPRRRAASKPHPKHRPSVAPAPEQEEPVNEGFRESELKPAPAAAPDVTARFRP